MLATPAQHSIGKRRAGVSAKFGVGYVIRRSDRGGELPAGLVAATKEFADRDQEWASASDQKRAADFHLSQATQAEQRADEGKLLAAADRRLTAQQASDEADARARDAEDKWWQAKRHYETQLAHARTDPALAGAPSDASLTISEDPGTQVRNRLALFRVAQKAVDATRDGRRPRARYVVRGNLDRRPDGGSQAGHDFSRVTRDLHSKLALAQSDLPSGARFNANDVGLTAPPQFLHAEGPTRVEIWIEPGPVLRDPAESGVSPNGQGRTWEDLRREAQRSRPVFSKLSALEQESLRWRAETVLARDHDFNALDGQRADDLLALHHDMAAVLARPLSQDDQRLADELSRNLAHEFQTARRRSTRPSPRPDTATVRTPDNGPARSARPGPSHAPGERGLAPIQEEPEPDSIRRRLSGTDESRASQIASTATDSPTDGDPGRTASTPVSEQALNDPEVEPEAPVVLPAAGSELRREGWGAGLPTEVTGPKRQGPGGQQVAGTRAKRPRNEPGESSSAGVASGSLGGGGYGSAPTDLTVDPAELIAVELVGAEQATSEPQEEPTPPTQTKKRRKDADAKYERNNREKRAEWRRNNREKRARGNAKWRRDNKDEVKKYYEDYWQKNKEKIKAKRRQPDVMIAKLSALSDPDSNQQIALGLWRTDRKSVV